MIYLNRRQFLQGLSKSAIAGSALSSPLTALANTEIPSKEEQFFILVRLEGGWDTSLSLDPWLEEKRPDPSDMFVEYRPDEILTTSSGIKLGPAAQPIVALRQNMSVVNGLFLSATDGGHFAALSYMSTGNGENLAPSLPIELEVASRSHAFGALSDTALYTADRQALSSSVADLKKRLSGEDPTEVLSKLYSADFLKEAPSPYLSSIFNMVSNQHINKAFIKSVAEILQGESRDPSTTELVAASFLSGGSRFAQLDFFDRGLDTHSNHPKEHLAEQKNMWQRVTDLVSLFEKVPFKKSGESLMDRTTLLVVSEFSRTPALNGAKGKDHNPMSNSALFIGRNVPQGRVLGGTRLVPKALTNRALSYHIAYPMDFVTGLPVKKRSENGEILKPEHIVQTVGHIMGVSKDRFRSVDSKVKVLPGFA